MSKSGLRLLLEFAGVTVPLTWLWMNGGGDAYFSLYKTVAYPILGALGVTSFPPGLVRDRMISFIPFLALMVVTPHIRRVRRLVGIGLGFALLFVSHIVLSWWAWVSFVRDGRSAESMLWYFPALVMADALPFVLWAVFANRFLRELLERVVPQAEQRPRREGRRPRLEEGRPRRDQERPRRRDDA